MSARAPDRAEVQAKLIATLQRHGVVIKLLTGRMVVQEKKSSGFAWSWYGATDQIAAERSELFQVEDVAAAVLDQCGTRAVLAALEGEGG